MSDSAISVRSVSKDFVLPHERKSSIKTNFTSILGGSLRSSKATQHALRDISLEIKHGEFYGIVGRNGSGKSTLLKILAGIYQPTKGSVETHGRLVPFIELGVGFNPELTGRENVYLNGAILGFTEREVDANYQDIVHFAELEDFMDQKLKNYSSGMQVRLAFACATRAKADILLVDEILAVGDEAFQQKCFDYFYELKSNNKTVVFVSHDMQAVAKFCDRGALIDNSEIRLIGSAEDVTEEYSRMMREDAHPSQNVSSKETPHRTSEVIPEFKVSIESRTIKRGDSLNLTLSYRVAAEAVLEARVAIVKDGIAVAHINSKDIKVPGGVGNNKIKLMLSTESLLSGKYQIYSGIFNEVGKELAFRLKAASFVINAKDRIHGGLFKIDGEWNA